MKFLFFCILSLGIFSCNIPKNNAPKADTEYQTKSSSSSNKNKDSLYIELKQCRFSQGDSIVILYSIKNQTQWHYIYLSDEYWIERQVKGKWIRIQNDFGSILMGKEIPAYSCINDYAKVFLKAGHYKFCNTAYSDDERIDNKKIVMKAYFEVKSCKHSNQDISHFRTNDLFYTEVSQVNIYQLACL